MLPLLLPAIASGAALSFARAMREYGSVLLISGDLRRTTVSSVQIFQKIQNYDTSARRPWPRCSLMIA